MLTQKLLPYVISFSFRFTFICRRRYINMVLSGDQISFPLSYFCDMKTLDVLQAGLPWWSLLPCSRCQHFDSPQWSLRWAPPGGKLHSWAEVALVWRWTDPPRRSCPDILKGKNNRMNKGTDVSFFKKNPTHVSSMKASQWSTTN